MQALVKERLEDTHLVLKDVPKPKLEADGIIVKVHGTGICGTDIHIVRNEYLQYPPVILGHEYSGTVEKVGKHVRNFKPGDRVVSMVAVETCGECEFCRQGRAMLCPTRRSLGSGRDGAFAEYIQVPARYAFSVPDNVSLDEAILTEPLACVVKGVLEHGRVEAGNHVYVSGPGIIGQFALQLAAASGGKVVIGGMSSDADRLKLAEQLGAAGTITADREDPVKKAMELTRGRGFDVVFECSGAEASADTCLQTVRKAGRFSQLGLYGKPIRFDMDTALMKEVHMTSSFGSEWTSWAKTIELMRQGQLQLAPLFGPKFKLKDWKRAFDAMVNKEGFKVVLTP